MEWNEVVAPANATFSYCVPPGRLLRVANNACACFAPKCPPKTANNYPCISLAWDQIIILALLEE